MIPYRYVGPGGELRRHGGRVLAGRATGDAVMRVTYFEKSLVTRQDSELAWEESEGSGSGGRNDLPGL